jgi:hypothetical protein
LWLSDGSSVRLRPLHCNHVWSFDFVQGQTHDGRSLRILTLIDEHWRACLALKVARRINSLGVIEALADAMYLHGIPENIRCSLPMGSGQNTGQVTTSPPAAMKAGGHALKATERCPVVESGTASAYPHPQNGGGPPAIMGDSRRGPPQSVHLYDG